MPRNLPSSASWPTAGGTRERVPPAAPDQPAAPGLDRRTGRAVGQARAGRRLRRRHPGRVDGRARRARDGIDLAAKPLGVARLHALESGVQRRLPRDRRRGAGRRAAPASFDVVTCMEMLEHVPDPASVVRACATLVRPGGWVFFSTLNRNPKAFLFAIVGAEYVLRPAAQGHARVRALHPAERTGALVPRRRPPCRPRRAWSTTP
jgi:SAM-dependent methyltransferase